MEYEGAGLAPFSPFIHPGTDRGDQKAEKDCGPSTAYMHAVDPLIRDADDDGVNDQKEQSQGEESQRDGDDDQQWF